MESTSTESTFSEDIGNTDSTGGYTFNSDTNPTHDISSIANSDPKQMFKDYQIAALDTKIELLKTEILELKDSSKKEIDNLKMRCVPEEKYFRLANTLNSTSLFVILISPIAIVLSTFAIFSYFGDHDKLVDAIMYVIGLIGIGGLLQVIKSYYQLNSIENTLEEIYRKVDE